MNSSDNGAHLHKGVLLASQLGEGQGRAGHGRVGQGGNDARGPGINKKKRSQWTWS